MYRYKLLRILQKGAGRAKEDSILVLGFLSWSDAKDKYKHEC